MEKVNVRHEYPDIRDRSRSHRHRPCPAGGIPGEHCIRCIRRAPGALLRKIGAYVYRIKKFIREKIVYAVQNLIQDTPFSKMDLISCRNVLIYMGMKLQRKVLPLFHYSLNEGGYLFLGSSESIGRFDDLFSTIEAHCKIYQRKDIGSRPWAGTFPQTEEVYAATLPTQGQHDRKKEDLGHLSAQAMCGLICPSPCHSR